MATKRGRLALIAIAGFLICVAESPRVLGSGEANAQGLMTRAGAENQVVGPNQLNEGYRTLSNDAFRTRTAAADVPIRRVAPIIVAASDSTVWDETSFVGKIFVVFGALLTLASAARMFIA
jgi:hypothetical protein